MRSNDKHYVIALGLAILPDVLNINKGTIISRHTDSMIAAEHLRKYNARNGLGSSSSVVFGVLSTDEVLKKGDVRVDLADRWIAEKYDSDAIYAMKCIIDPIWHGGHATSDERIAWMLEDLKISVEVLREKYQDAAQAELNEHGARLLANAERTARLKAVGDALGKERSQFTYTFPAVAGLQAGRVFYVAQVPLGVLVRLFRFDEEDVVPAEMRAQRTLNHSRGEAIGNYIVANKTEYILPAITASVSAEMSFEPYEVSGAAGSIGLLHIPMESTLLINDGQHRRYGIEVALKRAQALSAETIAVTLYFDQGLHRSQQMFADINGKQVKPSSAINALYDRRNEFNAWVIDLIDAIPDVCARVDMENSTVPAKSLKLWSLISFRKTMTLLTGVTEKNIETLEPVELADITVFVIRFFSRCADVVPQWKDMVRGKICGYDVREQFVIGHAVWLEGLATYARHALFPEASREDGAKDPSIIDPKIAKWSQLQALKQVDPRKASPMWANRCVVLGKMQKTSDGVNSTAARLLLLSNITLPNHMRDIESRLAA